MFLLDSHSTANLNGVHPDLVRVVQDCAANFSGPAAFGISCGLRTVAQQRLAVQTGKSQTMNSRHLNGHAVDLVALISGQAHWDWPLYYTLADQIRLASIRCKVPLIWGGCWDKEEADWVSPAMNESAAYVIRGGHFLDGPHHELSRRVYP